LVLLCCDNYKHYISFSTQIFLIQSQSHVGILQKYYILLFKITLIVFCSNIYFIYCLSAEEEVAKDEKPKSLSQALEEEQKSTKTTEKPKLPEPEIPEAEGNILTE